jgi:hypothetical protein
MSDPVRISAQASTLASTQAAQQPSPIQSTRRAEALGGYGTANDMARQAAATQPMNGSEFQRAVGRLTKTLDANEPMRTDVPRGFYLNIRV